MYFPQFQSLPFSRSYLWVASLVLGVFQLVQVYTDYRLGGFEFPFSWYVVSTKILSTYISWVLLATFVFNLAAALYQWNKDRLIGRLISLTGLSLVLLVVHVGLSTLVNDLLNLPHLGYVRSWFQPNRKPVFVAKLFNGTLQQVAFTGFFIAYIYYQNFLEQQKALHRARLDALMMQLRPHFLFNTLNSIASLIDFDAPAAQKMVLQLSKLMRQVLKKEGRDLVMLAEELQFLRHYLDIESIRFEDRLKVQFDIAEPTLQAMVPTLLLQPIVENAIKHGINKKKEAAKLEISSRVLKQNGSNWLEMQVKDNGAGFDIKKQSTSKGLGIKNVKKRLTQHYFNQFLFEMDAQINYGCKVTIKIPFNASK